MVYPGPPVIFPDFSQVCIIQSRPKPQCWKHGCNGRQFSTFSNLQRHQREQSGLADKATCPSCRAEFTRTTARNAHVKRDKCKVKQTRGAKRPTYSRCKELILQSQSLH